MTQELIIRHLPQQAYQQCWESMQAFTDTRDGNTPDELWLLQHPPVFTQGSAGKAEHVLDSGDIPVIQTDRGGQVTYHGQGQLVAYVLFDLRRLEIGIKRLVTNLEIAVIMTLLEYGVEAQTRSDAPGVYVDNAKICSIGLRVRKGCSYHGIAFNVKMDTLPFKRINPCGFQGLAITQLSDFVSNIEVNAVEEKLVDHISEIFEFQTTSVVSNRQEQEAV